ncbi:EamA family transporter [Erwinia tracheiphila]|uniref:ABC transporter permease n=1 Tax=Erwinia tracheiphila TaxID=65700 RepID=A0A0M2KDL0_9GAMM|nr:EamA family transporter [Erwinia tracheiphila]EOS96348.1 protein pecM [Erwinia tracheiphila PSU-1]KKF35051.1 ABC transporter permease [Erwinia tracheiphila]UIA86707.1 EamA family transporter [Erwinia tracheiphila]UIA95063.1 EamA family transporter [Erwinia tracheiphila]
MNKLSTFSDILITALAPVIWGSTYIVTTQTLPPHMPLLASVIRALGAGCILLLICQIRPHGIWWLRIAILGFLNIGLFFYCLFAAAYFLPGGLASLVMSCQPIIVMVVGAIIFRHKLRPVHLFSAAIGVTGIGLLVLNSAVALNFKGVAIGLIGTFSMAMGILLNKHWGRPENMSLLAFTGWQLAMGGLMLLPAALTLEKLPETLTFTNMLGYGWLTLAGGVLGYVVWFRGIEKLPPVTTSFLGFISSLSACVLGYIILGQTFTQLQLLGCVAIVSSIYLARPQHR